MRNVWKSASESSTPPASSSSTSTIRPEQVTKTVDDALGGSTSTLWLTDKKGQRVGVPTDKIAFVEVAE